MISDERIERAAKVVALTDCGQRKFDDVCAKNKALCVCRNEVRAALEADAPEIAAGEIRGMEMAKEHVVGVAERYRFAQQSLSKKHGSGSIEQWGAGIAALALEEVSHEIARIAELKAKTDSAKPTDGETT